VRGLLGVRGRNVQGWQHRGGARKVMGKQALSVRRGEESRGGRVGDKFDSCRKCGGAQQWQRKGKRKEVMQTGILNATFGSL